MYCRGSGRGYDKGWGTARVCGRASGCELAVGIVEPMTSPNQLVYSHFLDIYGDKILSELSG